MKIGDIEKGVPIPRLKSDYFKIIHLNCERLEIGDSFKVVDDIVSPRSIATSIGRRKRKNKKKFVVRKESSNTSRVWRIN